jgi:hypothetical protein
LAARRRESLLKVYAFSRRPALYEALGIF